MRLSTADNRHQLCQQRDHPHWSEHKSAFSWHVIVISSYHHILMSPYLHIPPSHPIINLSSHIGDHLRLNSQTSTKIGLDQLDSLCCMMEELSLLREQNSRLQKQLNFMEVLSSLSYHHLYLYLVQKVSMKTRAAFGSMGSMKMDGSGSSDLLLGSSRSRTGRYFSPLARSIVHIYTCHTALLCHIAH